MPRVDAEKVLKNIDTSLDLDEVKTWLPIAEDFVDDIAAEDSTIGSNRLANIERLLAQHLITIQDPRVDEYKEGDATVKYNRVTDLDLKASQYGQAAIGLDPTGVLSESGKPDASFHVPDSRNIG